MSCPAYLIKTKSDEKWLADGGYFDETEPLRFRKFYDQYVVLIEDCIGGKAGEKAPMLEWQYREIICPLLGMYQADGSRRFSEAIIFTMKKVSKTTLLATLCLYELITNRTGDAYIIASTLKQAGIMFKVAERILRTGPLRDRVRQQKKTDRPIWIHNSEKRIEYTRKDGFRSTLTVLAFTPDLDGPSASLLCADEMAAWPKKHASDIWDKIDNSTMARGGLKLIISTPQYDMDTVGYSKYMHAKRILDCKANTEDTPADFIDPYTLPVIYAIPDDESCICGKCTDGEKEAWRCPAQWAKHNPSLGKTVKPTYYAEKYSQIGNDPVKEVSFRTYLGAQWVGNSHQWISSNVWHACKSDKPLEYFRDNKIPCMAGGDFSLTQDLTAIVLAFKENEHIYLFGTAYLPEEGLDEKAKYDRVRYRDWERQGWLKTHPGTLIDFNLIRQDINSLFETYNIQEFRYDPSKFQLTASALLNEDGRNMVNLGNGIADMHQPTTFFGRGVRNGTIHHDGRASMAICMANTSIRMVDERIKIDKKKSTGRIDLIIASIIACSGVVDSEHIPESYGLFV